jgi:small subunit ribosomal protein S18
MGYQRSDSGGGRSGGGRSGGGRSGGGRSGGGRSGGNRYGRGSDQSDNDGEGRGKRRFARKRVCEFCVGKDKVIDYKKADELKRYVSEYGRLRPRRQTGACAKHQRAVAVAVKRARHIALLPFVVE